MYSPGSTLDALRQLLSTVVFVQEIVGDFLEISKMAVEERRSDSEEVRVAGVVNLDNTPGVLTSANLSTTNLNNLLGTNNCEWHKSSELGVLLNGVLVILLDVVREVVNGNAVVLNILHNELLRLSELTGSERVGAANNGDNVDAGSKALHELDVEFSETTMCEECLTRGGMFLPVTGRGDEVEHSMNSVVPETRVSLDTRLLGKNIVILSLKISDNL